MRILVGRLTYSGKQGNAVELGRRKNQAKRVEAAKELFRDAEELIADAKENGAVLDMGGALKSAAADLVAPAVEAIKTFYAWEAAELSVGRGLELQEVGPEFIAAAFVASEEVAGEATNMRILERLTHAREQAAKRRKLS